MRFSSRWQAFSLGLWVHGHTHGSFDSEVNCTHVVRNPRGDAKDGVADNPAFDPGSCVTVSA